MSCPHQQQWPPQFTAIDESLKGTKLVCHTCKVSTSLWLCLTCAQVHCGRYVHGHALSHYQASQHPLCLDLSSLACHCYACDDFVVETGEMEQVRGFVQERLAPAGSKKRKRLQHSDSNLPSGVTTPLSPTLDRIHALPGEWSNAPFEPRVPIHVGLHNLGNTCFMNAILQVLAHTRPFVDCFLQTYQPQPFSLPRTNQGPLTRRQSSQQGDVSLCHEYRALLLAMTATDPFVRARRAVSPDGFLSAVWQAVPSFRGYQQQDAHEFLRYMLDRLHCEMTLTGTDNHQSVVTKIFGGVLLNTLTCLKCHQTSKKEDAFLDLSLDCLDPLPVSTDVEANNMNSSPVRRATRHSSAFLESLESCLSTFTRNETLSPQERPYCSHCHERTACQKQMTLKHWPRVLCLQLKRFKWAAKRLVRTKVAHKISYPLEVDIEPFVEKSVLADENSPSTKYALYGVVMHHGAGSGSGHYTALVKVPQSDNSSNVQESWFLANDRSMSRIRSDQIVSSNAYILFYEQISM